MSEAAAETTTDTPAQGEQSTDQGAAATPPTMEELQAKVEELTRESRKWEGRAKENGTKAKELDQQRKAAMTEAERAVAEAEERGRTAAATNYGKRLARSEFDAVAGRRNPDFDTASALEFVDLSRFLGDDGEPDSKAIQAAVERLVPAPSNGAPSFDGGSRTSSSQGGDMNSIIRKAAGLG